MEKISAKYMLKYIDYFRKDNRKLYAIEEKNGIYYPAYDKTFIQFEEDFRNLLPHSSQMQYSSLFTLRSRKC